MSAPLTTRRELVAQDPCLYYFKEIVRAYTCPTNYFILWLLCNVIATLIASDTDFSVIRRERQRGCFTLVKSTSTGIFSGTEVRVFQKPIVWDFIGYIFMKVRALFKNISFCIGTFYN